VVVYSLEKKLSLKRIDDLEAGRGWLSFGVVSLVHLAAASCRPEDHKEKQVQLSIFLRILSLYFQLIIAW
jgi:hypothetical protein